MLTDEDVVVMESTKAPQVVQNFEPGIRVARHFGQRPSEGTEAEASGADVTGLPQAIQN